MIVFQIVLQVILIAVNALFAATEIAVISLNEKKVSARAEEGDKKAKKMLRMIEKPTRFLSTIQIGITLAGFLGSAFAADNFGELLAGAINSAFSVPASAQGAVETVSVVLITLVLSYFTLVFGELVPKRVAMRNKEKLSEAVCGFITGLSVGLKPVIWLLTVTTNGVLRLCGIDPNEKEEAVREEDIVLMLDAGADEGTLDKEDIRYIKNVFKLDHLTAGDVMTPRRAAVLLPLSATQEEALELVRREGYSRIPVYKDTVDEIAGILHAKEFLLRHGKADFRLEDAILPPMYVPETMKLDRLFRDMQKERTHLAIVVSEHGEFSGVITMEDVLEELVGEIWDEGDETVEEIRRVAENTYRVLGRTECSKFFDFFCLEAPEEMESTTVNGFLSEQVGAIPAEGESFSYETLVCRVIRASDVMAEEIEVTVTASEPPAPQEP